MTKFIFELRTINELRLNLIDYDCTTSALHDNIKSGSDILFFNGQKLKRLEVIEKTIPININYTAAKPFI